MNIKYKEIKSADNILKTLLKTPQEPRLSYRLSKLLKKFTTTLDRIDEEGNALVRKHGELANGRYNVAPDKMDAFTAEFVTFLDGETEIDFEPIPFDLLEKSGVKISPDDMIALDQFITEPVEAELN
jgi:hypothetical protein